MISPNKEVLALPAIELINPRKHSAVSHVVLHVTPGNTAILCNGRVVTPLPRASSEDLQLIETLELRSGAGFTQIY